MGQRRGRDAETDALIERLRGVGQRATPQRLLILGALRPGEHLSADDILARLEDRLPGLNRSTVYRALETFRDLGLVSETDLGEGVRQFELLAERHHHLVCRHCGDRTELDDALVAPLRAAIQAHHGFAAAIDHLALFGACAACAADLDSGTAAPGSGGNEREDVSHLSAAPQARR